MLTVDPQMTVNRPAEAGRWSRPAEDCRARRIVLVQTQAEAAGAQEISRLLADRLGARGYAVHQIFLFRRTAAFDDVADTVFCADRRPDGVLPLARLLRRLFVQLRGLRPDVVVCFQHYGNLIGAPIARLAGVNRIIANLNTPTLGMPGAVRLLDAIFGVSGMYSAIVANSRTVEEEYGRHPRRYRERLCRIDHGFELRTSALTRAQARVSLGLALSPVLLGCVARLHKSKNLAAAIRLLPREPGWHLALAGQGPDRAALETLAGELGCAGRVHFVGELRHDRVGSFLRALDVFVYPSSYETFGLAVVEAAQAGVPVVANRLDVLEEVLSARHEPCALFVAADDTTAFAAGIHRLLDDPLLAATLAARSKALASRYSLDAMVDRYAALIDGG